MAYVTCYLDQVSDDFTLYDTCLLHGDPVWCKVIYYTEALASANCTCNTHKTRDSTQRRVGSHSSLIASRGPQFSWWTPEENNQSLTWLVPIRNKVCIDQQLERYSMHPLTIAGGMIVGLNDMLRYDTMSWSSLWLSCPSTCWPYTIRRNSADSRQSHYRDVIMSAMASQMTSPTIVYSTVCSGADQRRHQSSTSLAFVWGIHRWPVNSPHKWPMTSWCQTCKLRPRVVNLGINDFECVFGERTTFSEWPPRYNLFICAVDMLHP